MSYFVFGFIFHCLITEKCPNYPNYVRNFIHFIFLETVFLEPSEMLHSCSCYPMTCYIPGIFHHLYPGDILCLFLKEKKIPIFWILCLSCLGYTIIFVQHSFRSFLRKDAWEVNILKPLNAWILSLPSIC